MLKQEIQFTDFNDNLSVETLYFNLSKSEIADNLDLMESFEELQDIFKVEHDLAVAEIQKMLNLVKKVMKLSYGVRSVDGKSFFKSEEQWHAFTMTAAYDHFLISLFEDPNKANAFLAGVMPQDIMREAEAKLEAEGVLQPVAVPANAPGRPVPQDRLPKKKPEVRTIQEVPLPNETNTIVREFESQEDYDAFVAWKASQQG